MAKKQNWLWIALGIVILVVILAVAAVAGFGYYMYRQMEPSQSIGAQTEQEFDAVRARFQGDVPYIEFSNENGEGTVHHEQERSDAPKVTQVRVVAYNPDDKKLVRVTLPMWLLSYARNKPISISGTGGGGVQWDDRSARLKITPADIERHGPGLIIDTTGRNGEKVIIWAE